MKKPLIYILFIGFISIWSACKKNEDKAGLTISIVFPNKGPKNTEVLIVGTGFDAEAKNNTVLFNGKEAEILEATATTLKVVLPVAAGTGPVEVINKNAKKVTGPDFFYRWTPTVSVFNNEVV